MVGADLRPRGGVAHVRGDTSEPLWRKTVWQTLADTAREFPDRDAAVFVDRGIRWSWSEFLARCDGLAAGFQRLRLVKGDRVGIWSPNRPEWLLTQFATARLGLILVNINPAYRKSELEYALNKAGCRALILAAGFKSSDYVQILASARAPQLEFIIRMGREKTAGMLNFDDLAETDGTARASVDVITTSLDPDDAINIQFTSGTTGSPKGATLSHVNIINNARFVTAAMNFTERDRLCIPVPLYHCFGMVMGTLGCASKGATMVFPGEGFEPGAALAAIAKEKCTGVYGVPTMFVAMLGHPDFASFDLSVLRTGIMAGSPCPIEVMKKVVSLMHAREITIAYGMTETSPVSFQSHIDDPLEKRVATVGRVHPHVEVKAIRKDGMSASIGEPGELCTRGYSVMLGYWEDDERTREAIDADGFMHTGDLATIDGEGYANIVGRVKDMLIRGGENVYPREVEEFLYRHPKIKDVQVFGVPDDKYGEEVCAFVVLKPGERASEEEIRAFCEGEIAHYKVPRYVRFKDILPMTVTGKPQKFLMREEMIAELGLGPQKTA